MPPPTNVSDVRCFLGMVNQLAKFAGDLAEQSAPIRDLLRKDRAWSWDVVQQMVFDRSVLRSSQADTRVRRQPIAWFRRRTVQQQQLPDGTWRPVSYASRSLSNVERRYAQIENECLALT
jgi:membrane-bound lytic murein transglycosylase B